MKIKFRVSTEANIRNEVESYNAGTITFTERGIYLCVEGDGTTTNGSLVVYDGLSTENFLNSSTGDTASKPSTDLYDGKVYFDKDVKKMYVAMNGIWEEISGQSQTTGGTQIEVVTTKPDNSEGENNDVKIDSVAKVLYCKVNNVWETIGISEIQFNDLSTRITNLEQELTISVNSLQDVIANRVNVKALYMPISISPDLVILRDTDFETLIPGVDLSYDETIKGIKFSTPIVVESGKADSICQHTILIKNGITDYKGLIFAAPCMLTCVAEVKNTTDCIGNSIGGGGGNKKMVTLKYTTTPTTISITGTNGTAQFNQNTVIIAIWDSTNNCHISAYNPDTNTIPVSVSNKYSNNQVLGITRGFGVADTTNLYGNYTNEVAVIKAVGIKASSTVFDNNTALKDLVSEYNKLWL